MLYVDNEILVVVSDLRDAATGERLDGATVQATIEDRDGNQLKGPITLDDAAEKGDYSGTFGIDGTLQVGEHYVVVVTADVDGGGADAEWRIPEKARTRDRS